MAEKSILLVDDDKDLVDALKAILESAGYKVTAAGNRTDGLARARELRPDLAIVDVMMDADTDGFDLTYDLRRDEDLKDLPILMLTGINQRLPFNFSPEADGEYIPVNKFLEKPVDPETLLKEVAALL